MRLETLALAERIVQFRGQRVTQANRGQQAKMVKTDCRAKTVPMEHRAKMEQTVKTERRG